MHWKKITTLVLIPWFQNSFNVIPKINTSQPVIQKALENRDVRFLKLSNLIEDLQMFKIHRKNFIQEDSDLELLKEVENFIFTDANVDKKQQFNDSLERNQIFPDFETLSQEIKEKIHVKNNSLNKYFIRNSSVDLNEILEGTPDQNVDEVKEMILKLYNFLAIDLTLEQVSKILLTISKPISGLVDTFTTYFDKLGAIAMHLNPNWWSHTYYGEEKWIAVKKNGTTFIHEFSHALSFFTRHKKNEQLLLNSLNIKKIYNRNSPREWDVPEPYSFLNMRVMNVNLKKLESALLFNFSNGIARNFFDYIYDKIIDLLNENKEDSKTDYDKKQPINRFFMLVCSLIPSVYAKHSVIKANVNLMEDVMVAIEELFAESMVFLLAADDEEKNIFWEWTYDYIVEQENLKKFFNWD